MVDILKPQASTEVFNPDQLIAGDLKIVTKDVVIASSAALLRGAVLGKVTATGKYKLSASAAGDGSEVPRAILINDVDASGGDVAGSIYQTGEFNAGCLSFGTGHSAASVEDALNDAGIYLKTAISNADPT